MIIMPPLGIAAATTGAFVLGQLGGQTSVTMGEAIGVFVFVTTLIVWLARRLQKMEDELAYLRVEVARLPCARGQACPPPASYARE